MSWANTSRVPAQTVENSICYLHYIPSSSRRLNFSLKKRRKINFDFSWVLVQKQQTKRQKLTHINAESDKGKSRRESKRLRRRRRRKDQIFSFLISIFVSFFYFLLFNCFAWLFRIGISPEEFRGGHHGCRHPYFLFFPGKSKVCSFFFLPLCLLIVFIWVLQFDLI